MSHGWPKMAPAVREAAERLRAATGVAVSIFSEDGTSDEQLVSRLDEVRLGALLARGLCTAEATVNGVTWQAAILQGKIARELNAVGVVKVARGNEQPFTGSWALDESGFSMGLVVDGVPDEALRQLEHGLLLEFVESARAELRAEEEAGRRRECATTETLHLAEVQRDFMAKRAKVPAFSPLSTGGSLPLEVVPFQLDDEEPRPGPEKAFREGLLPVLGDDAPDEQGRQALGDMFGWVPVAPKRPSALL